MTTTASEVRLGIPGFTYPDLFDPVRLRDLYTEFCGDVARRDPDLWSRWQGYAAAPASLPPIDRSDLIVQMAPHVSRFLTRRARC
jgi:hypothetical protein